MHKLLMASTALAVLAAPAYAQGTAAPGSYLVPAPAPLGGVTVPTERVCNNGICLDYPQHIENGIGADGFPHPLSVSNTGALNLNIASGVVGLTGTLPAFTTPPHVVVDSAPVATFPSSLSISNFPSTQPVSGSVAISNLPATQPVSGTVGLAPNTSVSVSNLPGIQAVSGTVAVSNLPATQPVSGTVALAPGTAFAGDLGNDCDVVSGDAAFTPGQTKRCQMTPTGRVKVGLSSAAAVGATASSMADLGAMADRSGLQQSLKGDAAGGLLTSRAPASYVETAVTLVAATWTQVSGPPTAPAVRQKLILSDATGLACLWARTTAAPSTAGEGVVFSTASAAGSWVFDDPVPQGAVWAKCTTAGVITVMEADGQ